MQNILTLPLCQGSYSESKNHEKINNSVKHGTIELISHDNYESTMPSLEEISVVKAKKALSKMLLSSKEAVQVFANLEQLRKAVKIFNERKSKEQLPANITEAPKFHEPLDNQIENPRKQVQESFARQQVARAKKYNVPYSFYTVDIYELSKEIDRYEFLLREAKDLGIYWDISEYDPVALEQEIEEHKESERRSNNLMYSDYYSSRRVAL